jgi:hypothetical protein
MFDCSLRSRGSRFGAAAFLSHTQTKSVSAHSFRPGQRAFALLAGGWASNRRSSVQLLPDQRSNLGSEELDRAHGFCMINMGDVQLETIDMHQLMQPDDLVGHGLGPTEEQGAFGSDQIFDGRIRHRGPATFLADLGERLAIRRQELRSCCALVGEDLAVAVYRQWGIRIMMPVSEGLAVEIDERGKRRRPATDDRQRHRKAERTGPDD